MEETKEEGLPEFLMGLRNLLQQSNELKLLDFIFFKIF